MRLHALGRYEEDMRDTSESVDEDEEETTWPWYDNRDEMPSWFSEDEEEGYEGYEGYEDDYDDEDVDDSSDNGNRYSPLYSRRAQDEDEVSSQESRCGYIPPPPYVPAAFCCPIQIRISLSQLRVPQLKAQLKQWKLSLKGRKDELIARIADHVSTQWNTPEIFNRSMDELNVTASTLKRGWRPFCHLPEIGYSRWLLKESAGFANMSYLLPSPWILESKLTQPIVTSFAKPDAPINITFDKPAEAGGKYLLVALRIYPDTAETGRYRHAYIRNFTCCFSTKTYSTYYQRSNVHDITGHLKDGRNEWLIRGFRGLTAGKTYLFQIVKAKRDYATWVTTLNSNNIQSKEEIMKKLQEDAKKATRDGISSPAVTISLRCPISLLRMKTPVRSKKCRHLQCFELSSWSQSFDDKNTSRCPVCNIQFTPEILFIDGLTMTMLRELEGKDTTEVLVNAETGEVKPLSVQSPGPLETNPIQESTSLVIDLTITSDERVDPMETVFIKPDPGATEMPKEPTMGVTKGPTTRVTKRLIMEMPPSPIMRMPEEPTLLDSESDVITNPNIRPSQAYGRSIRDAIIID